MKADRTAAARRATTQADEQMQAVASTLKTTVWHLDNEFADLLPVSPTTPGPADLARQLELCFKLLDAARDMLEPYGLSPEELRAFGQEGRPLWGAPSRE